MAPNASVRVCVFGSGSFGTALGTVIARNGFTVKMLTRRQEVVDAINTKHRNPTHLTDCDLPPLLSATSSPAEALKGASFVVHCIPVQSSAEFLAPLKDLIPSGVPIISTSKGLHSDTLETMDALVPRALERDQPMAFFSGPTFAKELMTSQPSAAIIASKDQDLAESCAVLFHCDALRIYTTTDVVGVEVGGALKNVYALGAGMLEGMGLGVNSMAFSVTRACAEMNELAVKMGARAHTMTGLSGMGDLMLTCMGGASRNKAVGQRIGRGESLEDVLNNRQQTLAGVAEGVATAPAAVRLARRHGVRANMIEAVAAILDGEIGAHEAGTRLMQLPRSRDFTEGAYIADMWQRNRPSWPAMALATIAVAEAGVLALWAWRASRRTGPGA